MLGAVLDRCVVGAKGDEMQEYREIIASMHYFHLQSEEIHRYQHLMIFN